MKQNNQKIIGLTGGIATGKSTASHYIRQKGYPIIDADLKAREIVKKGNPALKEIQETFGHEVITSTGDLNRSKLRSIVFNDPKKLEQLNKITHPKIIKSIKEEIKQLKGKHQLIFVDAPLLIEANMQSLVDEIWLISINKETQINRLMARDHISEQKALKIINEQFSLEKKKEFADEIIDNSKDKKHLYVQISSLLSEMDREVLDVL